MITLKFIQDLFYGRDPLSREEIILAKHFATCEKPQNQNPEDFALSRVESILILEANNHRKQILITPAQILGSEQDPFFNRCKDYVLENLKKIGLRVQDGDFDENMSQGIKGIYISLE